jgi:hypothetical protein
VSGFSVGDVVVCIDATPARGSVEETARLEMRRMYTIRGITRHGGIQVEGAILEGRNNYGEESGWHYRRFRPVRKTDISVFRDLVAPRPTVDA